MRTVFLVVFLVAGTTFFSSPLTADAWKDESGKSNWRGHFDGETPWWARGKGYWDGHFNRGRYPRQMSHPWGVHAGPPVWRPLHMYHEDFFKQQWKAQREYEKERHKAWRELERERAKSYGEHRGLWHRRH